jgi:membrane associated rhomboid family serine protease
MGKMFMIQRLTIVAMLCGTMIGVHIVDLFLGGFLKSFGIQPRQMGSVYTIFTAPWLHGSLAHLGSNLPPFALLSALCLINGVLYFMKVSAFIIVASGALVWIFGRDSMHIGSSGWLFGLWSLAMAHAWFDRSYRNIAVALAVAFFMVVWCLVYCLCKAMSPLNRIYLEHWPAW